MIRVTTIRIGFVLIGTIKIEFILNHCFYHCSSFPMNCCLLFLFNKRRLFKNLFIDLYTLSQVCFHHFDVFQWKYTHLSKKYNWNLYKERNLRFLHWIFILFYPEKLTSWTKTNLNGIRVDLFYPFWRTRVSYTIFQRYHPDTRKLSILGCVLKSDLKAVDVGCVLKKKSRLFSFWWMNVAWAPRYFWSSRYQAKSALWKQKHGTKNRKY